MLAWAIGFVLAFAPPFPVGDEFALWALLPPRGSLSWETLWSLHNEHRIPLPRLVHVVPYLLTGDLRTAMVLQVLVLGTVALGLVLLARRIRGSSSWSDTLFPLLFLHVGNWTNLLSGFQIALTLPTALTCAILAGIAISPELPRPGRAIGMGVCLACLPLCGAVGLSQIPVLGAWLAWVGWCGVRRGDREARRAGWILLVLVGASAAICGLYALEYRQPPWYSYSPSVASILGICAAVISLTLGPAAESAWPASGALVLGVLAATVVLLAVGIRKEPRERTRRFGLLAVIAALVCLTLTIGYGRSAFGWRHGFAERFVTLTAPLLCCAHLAWTLYGGARSRANVCGALAMAAWIALPFNARVGIGEGRDLRDRVERFEALVGTRPSALALVQAFMDLFPPHLALKSRLILETLAAEGKPPFDRGPAPSSEAFQYLAFSRVPTRVDSNGPTMQRFVDGHHVLVVRPGTAIHLDRLAGERRIVGRFGVPSEPLRHGHAPRIRVVVEAVPPGGPPRVLLDRTLQPASNAADRGNQPFELDVTSEAPGEIVLRTESVGGVSEDWSWSYWTGVVIE